MNHHVEDLIHLFNSCFLESHSTQLARGGEEPLYVPKDETHPYHTIWFARGFFSSALHEISHWLIAGEKRRQLVDYGYWYIPDGRSQNQQKQFEQVEIKPQALEWILSSACGYRFVLSVDNLSGDPGDISTFRQAIVEQAQSYCHHGLPSRAKHLRDALCQFYATQIELDPINFQALA
jgi:elongation factor P hydroxylase